MWFKLTLIILFMEMLKFSNPKKKKKNPFKKKLVEKEKEIVKANKEYFEASKIIYLFIYLDPEFSKLIN